MNRTKIVLALTSVGLVAIYTTAVLLSTTRDRVDQIDSDALRPVVRSACIDLRTATDALTPLGADASEQARQDRVSEQADLVAEFLEQVRGAGDEALDDDRPAREWLTDWETLLAARTTFADDGFQGDFGVPVQDGRPITDRMNDIGVEECRVPLGLTIAP